MTRVGGDVVGRLLSVLDVLLVRRVMDVCSLLCFGSCFSEYYLRGRDRNGFRDLLYRPV